MPATDAALAALAERYGVATGYDDWTGRRVEVPEETLIAVLGALGVAASTPTQRDAALAAVEHAYWSRPLPPTIIATAGEAAAFWVHVSHGAPAHLRLRLEDGTVRTDLQQLENHTPHMLSTDTWSERRASRCRPTYHRAITGCICTAAIWRPAPR